MKLSTYTLLRLATLLLTVIGLIVFTFYTTFLAFGVIGMFCVSIVLASLGVLNNSLTQDGTFELLDKEISDE